MQNKESKFNWKLQVYGAGGFGVGFVIGFAITNSHKIPNLNL